MRCIFLICLNCLCSTLAYAQNRPGIELSVTRIDQQANYPDHSGDVAFTNFLRLNLHQRALSIGYKLPVAKHLFFKAGLGYSVLRADGIVFTRTYPVTVSTNSRSIDAPNAILMPESTDAYQYQDLTFDLAIDRSFPLSRIFTIDAAVQYNYNWTFRQAYHLAGTEDSSLVHYDQHPLGQFISLSTGLTAKLGKFSTGPQLILPILTSLSGDSRFDENTHRSVHFWLHGIGLEWRIYYPIK